MRVRIFLSLSLVLLVLIGGFGYLNFSIFNSQVKNQENRNLMIHKDLVEELVFESVTKRMASIKKQLDFLGSYIKGPQAESGLAEIFQKHSYLGSIAKFKFNDKGAWEVIWAHSNPYQSPNIAPLTTSLSNDRFTNLSKGQIRAYFLSGSELEKGVLFGTWPDTNDKELILATYSPTILTEPLRKFITGPYDIALINNKNTYLAHTSVAFLGRSEIPKEKDKVIQPISDTNLALRVNLKNNVVKMATIQKEFWISGLTFFILGTAIFGLILFRLYDFYFEKNSDEELGTLLKDSDIKELEAFDLGDSVSPVSIEEPVLTDTLEQHIIEPTENRSNEINYSEELPVQRKSSDVEKELSSEILLVRDVLKHTLVGIRAPLSGIIGQCQLLQSKISKLELGEVKSGILTNIRSLTNQSQKLILDLSTVDLFSTKGLSKENIDLRWLIEGALSKIESHSKDLRENINYEYISSGSIEVNSKQVNEALRSLIQGILTRPSIEADSEIYVKLNTNKKSIYASIIDPRGGLTLNQFILLFRPKIDLVKGTLSDLAIAYSIIENNRGDLIFNQREEGIEIIVEFSKGTQIQKSNSLGFELNDSGGFIEEPNSIVDELLEIPDIDLSVNKQNRV